MSYLCYSMRGLGIIIRCTVLFLILCFSTLNISAQNTIEVLRYSSNGEILHAEVNTSISLYFNTSVSGADLQIQ